MEVSSRSMYIIDKEKNKGNHIDFLVKDTSIGWNCNIDKTGTREIGKGLNYEVVLADAGNCNGEKNIGKIKWVRLQKWCRLECSQFPWRENKKSCNVAILM